MRNRIGASVLAVVLAGVVRAQETVSPAQQAERFLIFVFQARHGSDPSPLQGPGGKLTPLGRRQALLEALSLVYGRPPEALAQSPAVRALLSQWIGPDGNLTPPGARSVRALFESLQARRRLDIPDALSSRRYLAATGLDLSPEGIQRLAGQFSEFADGGAVSSAQGVVAGTPSEPQSRIRSEARRTAQKTGVNARTLEWMAASIYQANRKFGNRNLMGMSLPTARSLGYRGAPRGLLAPDQNIHWGVELLGRLERKIQHLAAATGKILSERKLVSLTLAAYRSGLGAVERSLHTGREAWRASTLQFLTLVLGQNLSAEDARTPVPENLSKSATTASSRTTHAERKIPSPVSPDRGGDTPFLSPIYAPNLFRGQRWMQRMGIAGAVNRRTVQGLIRNIFRAAPIYGQDPVAIVSLCLAESGGDLHARSDAGAVGPCQILQDTPYRQLAVNLARGLDRHRHRRPREGQGDGQDPLERPEVAAVIASRYLKDTQKRLNTQNPGVLVAAYNAGPDNAALYMRRVERGKKPRVPVQTRTLLDRVAAVYRWLTQHPESLPSQSNPSLASTAGTSGISSSQAR